MALPNENYVDHAAGINNTNYDFYSPRLGNDIASEYSNKAYNVGDYCIFRGQLYRCTTAIPSGEGTTLVEAHWTPVKTTDEISDLQSALRQSRYVFAYRTSATPINYNTSTHTLSIYAGFVIRDINSWTTDLLITTETTELTWASSAQLWAVCYNTETSSFLLRATYNGIPKTCIVICVLGYDRIHYLPLEYTIDGKKYGVNDRYYDSWNYHFKYPFRGKCPNFDTTSQQLTIYEGTTIYNIVNGDSYQLSEDNVLSFDNTGDIKINWLLYNFNTHVFSLLRHNATIYPGSVIIGEIVASGYSWIIDGMTVNGYNQNVPVNDILTQITKLRSSKYLFSYQTSAKRINYDTATKILSIYAGFVIFEMNNFSNELLRTTETIEIKLNTNSQVNLVVYNTTTTAFETIAQYTANVPENKIPICIIGTNDIYGLPLPYTINGYRYGVVVPDEEYSLPSSWLSKVEDFKIAQKDCFSFLIQSDTHYYLDQDNTIGYNLQYLTHKIAFDFAANLGDLTRGYTDETIDSNENMRAACTQLMERYTRGICCPFISVVGNHETQSMYHSEYGTDYIYPNELYGRMIKPSLYTSPNAIYVPGKLYYYLDFPLVRVVVLYTNSYTDTGGFGISSEQLTWFTTEALNTNKAIIVLSHVPLVNGWSVNSNYHSSYADIITGLQTFKNNGGTVVGCFCGHIHTQEAKLVDGINHIAFINLGTRAEAVIVDLTNKTIETTTFGFSNNRSFTYQ